MKNIETYHEKQRQYSWFDSKPDGTILGQKVTALDRVGVYVPGGKAAYPSSVLMNIVPAKTAGVREIIMVTPPGKDGKVTPTTLVAAKEAGADKIYKVGGAQAIAALAYGTESISKVDKIVGPGNIYVALAKKAVYGHVSIDSIAGPSEILVLADETANPRYVAADLLSQAEHDEMASAILVTVSMELAEKVSEQTELFISQLSRGEIIRKSLDNYGHILVADTMDEAIDAANEIASEHLEIMTASPFEVLPVAAVVILWQRDLPDQNRDDGTLNLKKILLALGIGLGIGLYDGIVGPGTGTFAIIAFTTLMGFDLRTANGNGKVLNLASNYASLFTYLMNGLVVFHIGIPCAVSNILGNMLGSHFALKKGARFIRPMMLVVLVLLLGKLISDAVL